jgi:NADPH:quinone reductase-like Zn-dependent oxidoreductase
MKAIVIPRFGGPEVLELRDAPEPKIGANEVRVRVEAAGVNFADIMSANGGYPGTPEPPLVAGREFAGVIEATGERVMGYTQWGGFADLVAAHRGYLWPTPDGWTAAEAAAFPVNYFTAYLAYWKAGLLDRAAGDPAPRVLIHAVAGGVGTAAVQVGKLLGIEMYGTSSSDEKLQRVKEMGLQHAINYKKQDYEQAIRELTHSEGVDAVFEMLGGDHTGKSIRCVREFGRVIVYGSATGKASSIDTRALYAKGASVHGLWLTVLSGNKKVMEPAAKQMAQWIAQGKLRPVVGHTFPLGKAGDAFRLMLERKNFGKVVLTMK